MVLLQSRNKSPLLPASKGQGRSGDLFLDGGGPFKLFRAAMFAMQLSLGANNITSSDTT